MIRRLVRVLQRSRLKDAHLVLVGSGNLPRVRAAVEGRDSDIVVDCTRYYLHSLEIARQYHNVTSCSICLESEEERVWSGVIEKVNDVCIFNNNSFESGHMSYLWARLIVWHMFIVIVAAAGLK